MFKKCIIKKKMIKISFLVLVDNVGIKENPLKQLLKAVKQNERNDYAKERR